MNLQGSIGRYAYVHIQTSVTRVIALGAQDRTGHGSA